MQYYQRGIVQKLINNNTYLYKRKRYTKSLVCLDVETTSAYLLPNGDVIPFDFTKKAKRDKKGKKRKNERGRKIALLYEWTIGIIDTNNNKHIFYGRDLLELLQCLKEFKVLPFEVIIYVHNLAFEFVWLLNILQFTKVFARSPHKVIYAISENIEFRCSYFLTRLSLAVWGENIGFEKSTDLDYHVIRTPYTPMNKLELDYCERDILIMLVGLQTYIKRYGTIANIPLTQTGEVRRDIKRMYKNDYNYHQLMTKLLPRNAEEYKLLTEVFAGGYTHASYIYVNHLLKNIYSDDLSSAYPAVMCYKKFPVTPWLKVKASEYMWERYNNDKYSVLLDVTLYDVDGRLFNNYISSSKCYQKVGCVYDNGRISKAKVISMKITNVDFNIIRKTYNIGKIDYNNMWMSRNGYLDIKLVLYILKLFAEKTELKDIPEKEDIYLYSKQRINSVFGMAVTKIIQYLVTFLNGDWTINKPTDKEINEALDDLRRKPYKNILSYSQGIYVTAYVREIIWDIIQEIDFDVVYDDTDSIKHFNSHDELFERVNKHIEEQIINVFLERGIDVGEYIKYTSKGVEKKLGIFERDAFYLEFKTLGAKRYAFKKKDKKGNDVLGLTISGVSKTKGVNALKCVNDLKINMLFDYDTSGKNLLTYLNDMPQVIYNKGKNDEYISQWRYGVHLEPTTYELTLSKDFKKIVYGAYTEGKL